MLSQCEAPSVVPIKPSLALNYAIPLTIAQNLKQRIEAKLMDKFRPSLRGFAADACWGRSLFETGYATHPLLQGCTRFWVALFASQHGVHRLYISISHGLVVLAGDVRRTQNDAGPERLTQ